MSAGLRPLLKKGSAWVWEKEHEEEFNKIKNLLTSPTIAKPFDDAKDTILLTDASRLHRLGYALVQKQKGRIIADSARISVTHTDATVLRNNRAGMPSDRMGHTKIRLLPFFSFFLRGATQGAREAHQRLG